jgi:serine/threonine protein kinase
MPSPTAVSQPDEAAGTASQRRVGSYLLQRRLGSGAMGEVWLGWHQSLHSPAAVKLLADRPALRGRGKRFLDREWNAIARLSHPNIVGLYEASSEHLAMAFVDGPNLAQRLQTPIDPATALHLAIQVGSALSHAHERGVVHRDVKPSNILLDRAGTAYLGDFGLALIIEHRAAQLAPRGGTPGYMAPEQRGRGGMVGPPADQYALARTLMEMLSGTDIDDDDERALAAMPQELPDALRAILRRATSTAAARRFGDMQQLVDALADVDMSGLAPPVRLAPEQRLRAPFGWCGAPLAVRQLSPDIARADYSLRELERSGVLSAGSADEFERKHGCRDFGWSMHVHESRLGPVSESGVLARASDLVVLAHGTLCTRDIWSAVSMSVCRNNAQAVVLAPDLFGGGDSPMDASRAEQCALRPKAVVAMLLDWLGLLNVRDLPTVLVGHSAAAAALLSVTDDELGERTSRVALTPVFPHADREMRMKLRALLLALKGLGRLPAVKRAMGFAGLLHGPDTARYSERERQAMYDELLRLPVSSLIQIAQGVLEAVPAPIEQLTRCEVVISDDDPIAPEQQLLAALDQLGFPRRSIHRVRGGHLPHLEADDAPGWTMRNVDELARVIESMLASSRDGAPLSTAVDSTLLA